MERQREHCCSAGRSSSPKTVILRNDAPSRALEGLDVMSKT
jgi:hypothetical protein